MTAPLFDAQHEISISPTIDALHIKDSRGAVVSYIDKDGKCQGNLAEFQFIKYTLTAAQIKTLFSVPVEIIPAPGANKIIQIVNAAFYFHSGNTGFGAKPADMYFGLGSAFNLIFNTQPIGASPNTIQPYIFPFDVTAVQDEFGTFSGFTGSAIMTAGDGTDVVNQPLYYGSLTGPDPAGTGNGTLDLYVWYRVLDLN